MCHDKWWEQGCKSIKYAYFKPSVHRSDALPTKLGLYIAQLATSPSCIVQWLEHSTGVRKVIVTIPVEDSEFFFVSCSWYVDRITSHFFTKLKIYYLSVYQRIKCPGGCLWRRRWSFHLTDTCASHNEENSEMWGELHYKQLLIPTIYYLLLIHSTIHLIIFFTDFIR